MHPGTKSGYKFRYIHDVCQNLYPDPYLDTLFSARLWTMLFIMTTDLTILVIFGASGDLTQRKLIPALYTAYCRNQWPHILHIIGLARSAWDDDRFRQQMKESVQKFATGSFDEKKWRTFTQQLHYVSGDLTQKADFEKLARTLAEIEGDAANRLYYLALPPHLFVPVVEMLAANEMVEANNGWCRLVVEKPFGSDLKSAQQLYEALLAVFREEQVFQIDHYLGKETAQNILFLRFANLIFELLWNNKYVDNVQITVAESVDVGHRADYYDEVGVLRDMFQNHLLQLLCLVAMEPAASFEAEAIRHEKVKVLRAIRPFHPQNSVRAQYDRYRETEGVAADSQTATYAALRLYVDNWRWQGVPFYLRSGKALAAKNSEIAIVFKRPPHLMFPQVEDEDFSADVLSLCIQPDEGLHWRFEAKVPGTHQETRPVDMEFHYRTSFEDIPLPDAYERLLLDALEGDATLFARRDEIEAAWKLIDSIRESWQSAEAPPLLSYRQDSWGPAAADELLDQDDRHWRHNCGQHQNN